MADKSRIEWTDATWNPVTGCSKVSQGCKHCYALREWPRLAAPRPVPNIYTGRAFTDVRCHPERLEQPLHWTKPRRIFVNSMSDLFHERVPFRFIDQVFAVMGSTPWHTYQVLTKRPARALEYFSHRVEPGPLEAEREAWERKQRACAELDVALPDFRPEMARAETRRDLVHAAYDELSRLPVFNADRFWTAEEGSQFVAAGWPLPNVQILVSVEDQETANARIPLLLQIPAAVRGVSVEPLLGPVYIEDIPDPDGGECIKPLAGLRWIRGPSDRCETVPLGGRIDWVICGGESGPHARPMHLEWARSMRDQCEAAGVPFLFKQWGEWLPAKDGRSITGKVIVLEGAAPFKENPQWHGFEDGHWVARIGKKAAGRLLDGREHNEFPKGGAA